MHKRLACLGVLALVLTARPARAQDAGDIAAYFALTFTPQGSLPPVVQGPLMSGPTALTARYGRLSYGGDDDTFNNFALTVDLPAGARSRLGVTLGTVKSDCEGCGRVIGLALDLETLLVTSAPQPGSQFSIGFKPSFGIAKSTEDNDGTAMTATLGVPFALRTGGNGGIALVPYLVPALGYGRLSGSDDSESGMRPMLGGGLRVESDAGRLGAMVGFQKVFIEEGEMVFGAGLTFRGGAR